MLILATNTFFCTGFFGPSMAIMSACAPQGTKGSTMALNLVFSVLGPLAIIQIVGGLLSQNMMKLDTYLLWSVVPCSLAASFFYYLSGFNYFKVQERIKMERAETVYHVL